MALTTATVRGLREPGRYGDGNGLYLQVSGRNQRSWLFRFQLAGRAREMGLGSVEIVTLADARDQAEAARKLLRDGVDPIEHRRAGRQAAVDADKRNTSFVHAAQQYIAANEAGWRNPRHAQQWRNSIGRYALPVIGEMLCSAIGANDVLRVLEPIWHVKPATATRLRERIEIILSYATVRGWRDAGFNPAVWRGHLQLMLPAKSKIQPVKHHAALDWREAQAFMVQLRQQSSIAAAALQFTILTGARSGEVRGATWGEIDMDAAVWSLPAQRTKAGRAHRVPLPRAALDLLAELQPLRVDDASLIFPGQVRRGRPTVMTDVTLAQVLHRMGRGDVTVHGFRSTFRDWAAETTPHPNHVVELALAHAIGDKVEAAYRRGDLFEKRAALMADWATYLAKPPAEVVAFNRGQSALLAG